MTRDQALTALAQGESVRCTLSDKRLTAIIKSVFVSHEDGIKKVPQIANIIDQDGTIIPFEEIIEVYPSGDYYYIEYPPIKSIDDIKVGCWYDCGDDATVKILDKISDAFMVLHYSDNHKSFCLTTYPLEYVKADAWSRINPDYYDFYIWSKDSHDYVKVHPSELKECLI